MLKVKIFIIICLLFFSIVLSAQENLILNSGFEEQENGMPKDWRGEVQGCLVSNGYKGEMCLRISNRKPEWVGFEQIIQIDQSQTRHITVSAFVKVKDVVKGKLDWNYARIMVLFFNEKEQQIGGWPELGHWKGTFDWTKKEKIFTLPEGTRSVKVSILMDSTSGILWADDISVIKGKPERKFDPDNLLFNGGMEYGADIPEEWNFWGADDFGLVSPGKDSELCFYINAEKPNWALVNQTISLDGSRARKLIVSADYKLKDVQQGVQEWEKARVSLEFHDKNRQRIGGWPIVGEAIGTTSGWQHWENEFVIPPETAFLIVACGIGNTVGKIWLDNIIVKAYDEQGGQIKKVDTSKINTKKWFAFDPGKEDYSPTIIDMSFLLDKPAGKHGYIKNKKGQLVFEDGTKIRFWGLNIVAANAFISHEDSEIMAKRLAKLGCNLVRFHHLDASWASPNIFNNNPKTTRKLSEEQMEKLDYLIYQLIEQGIYIYMDLLVHRKLGPEDGIDDWKILNNGLKGTAHFDEKQIELQKEYAEQLLTHYNPYTKKKYIEEPAFIASEVINESSLFYIDRQGDFPEKYKKKLDKIFNEWLRKKYKTQEKLVKAWEKSGETGLDADESLNKGNIRRAKIDINWGDRLNNVKSPDSAGRFADTKLFYFELQYKHYKTIYDFLRKLGYKALITGSNHWESHDGDILSNAKLDHIDRHSYFDHPDTSHGWRPEDVSFQNGNVLMTLENNISELANGRVSDLPFFVTEWNIPFPNEWRIAGPVMMAAYANLQEWNGILQFAFQHNTWQSKITDLFDISQSPAMLSQWLPAAMLFHKGYVKPAENIIVDEDGNDNVFYNKEHSFRIIGYDLSLPLMTRIEKRYIGDKPSKYADVSAVLQKYHDKEKKIVKSDTGELKWNYDRGFIKINTPYIQGAVGNIGKKIMKFDDIELDITTPFCSIFLVSMDGKAIKDSKKMVLVAAAREMNTSMEYNMGHTRLRDAGMKPIIFENVVAKVWINRKKRFKVYPLDITGKRKKTEIKVKDKRFKISGQYECLYYGVGP